MGAFDRLKPSGPKNGRGEFWPQDSQNSRVFFALVRLPHSTAWATRLPNRFLRSSRPVVPQSSTGRLRFACLPSLHSLRSRRPRSNRSHHEAPTDNRVRRACVRFAHAERDRARRGWLNGFSNFHCRTGACGRGGHSKRVTAATFARGMRTTGPDDALRRVVRTEDRSRVGRNARRAGSAESGPRIASGEAASVWLMRSSAVRSSKYRE